MFVSRMSIKRICILAESLTLLARNTVFGSIDKGCCPFQALTLRLLGESSLFASFEQVSRR